jgi:hypothetical protein
VNWIAILFFGAILYWIGLGFVLTAKRFSGKQGVFLFVGSLGGNVILVLVCVGATYGFDDMFGESVHEAVISLLGYSLIAMLFTAPFSAMAAFVGYMFAMLCGYTDVKR